MRWVGSSRFELLGALFAGFGQDHLLDDRQALGLEEHVLGAAQADTLGAIGAGAPGILGIIRIRPNLHTRGLAAIRQDTDILAGGNIIRPVEQGQQVGLLFQ